MNGHIDESAQGEVFTLAACAFDRKAVCEVPVDNVGSIVRLAIVSQQLISAQSQAGPKWIGGR